MLRKFTTAAIYSNITQNRQICLKQCNTEKPKNDNEALLESRMNSVGGTLMLALVLNPPTFTNFMFPQIFKVPADKMPTIFEIIRKSANFNELIHKLPLVKTRLLTEALTTDMMTLQNALEPLSSANQRRVLDFIGLERIVALGAKDSQMAKESKTLEFFMLSESFNHVLRRKNHNYLYSMQQRENATIAARPGKSEL